MPQPIAQLVAVFLLVVQGLAALGPGRVLCVPMGDQGTHAAGHDAHAAGHGAPHDADHAECEQHDHGLATAGSVGSVSACHDHEHGVVLSLLHAHEDCGCHVHVPVKTDDTTPTTPRDRAVEVRPIFASLVVALLANWDWWSACVRTAEGRKPDPLASGQLRALKSTRLRI